MGLNKENIWDDFFSLLRMYKKEIIQVYVLGLVLSLLSLMFPIGIQLLINFIQGANYSVSLFVIIFLIAVSIILSAIFQIYQIRIIEYIEQKLFADYALRFVEKFPNLDYIELIYQNARDIANRFFDVVTLQKMVQKILIDFSYSSIIIVLSMILLCFYHPIFIVMVLILFVILYFGIKFTFKKGLTSGISYSKYKYDTAYWIEETGNASVTLKLAGQTDIHFQKLQSILREYFTQRNLHYYVLEKQFILLHAVKFVAIIFFVIVGGILVIEQQMNIGEFVASEIVISILVNSFDKMIFLIRTIYDLIISLIKISEVIDLKEEPFKSNIDNTNDLHHIKIDLKEVTYEYEYPKRTVLENINLQILPGESVLLIGESHSGKTTLLKLLATLIQPTKGHFLINDKSVNTYDINYLRYQIGTYLSNDVIFKGTILENIHLGRHYDINFLMKMSEKIGIHKIIDELPDKYETEMLTYGFNYSTSFITKLLFLRAIVTQPKLLILENMFNNIYEKDVPILLEIACNTKEYGWTTIISSSDAKYKDYFTKILQIKNGKLLMYDDISNYPY